MRYFISMVTLLFLGTFAKGQTMERFTAGVDSCLTEANIPGAAIAIVTQDSVLYTGGFGYADLENRVPVTEDTHFMLGSITKSFLALGIMKLVEEGRIELDTPVRQVLPDVTIANPWAETDPVRVVHLLEHTAGICDGFTMLFNWEHEPDIPLEEVIGLMHGRIDIHHRPGSFYLYSNIGYLLAGIILETIAQERYEDYLKREFLEPLGMETSTFDTEDPYSRSVLAQGYGAGGKEIPYLYAYPRSAAHTHSCVRELAQYVRFYLNVGMVKGKPILSRASMERVETPVTSLASRQGLRNGYGVGSEWSIRGGFPWRGHNGAMFGYYSDFWYNRELGVGYVVLVNQFDSPSAGNVRKLRRYVAEYLTRDATSVYPAAYSLSNEHLKEYTGTYVMGYGARDPLGLINSFTGLTRVERRDGTLVLVYASDEEEKLVAVAENLFRKEDVSTATVAFFNTEEGQEALVRDRDYLERGAGWKSQLVQYYLLWCGLMLLLALLYGIFWLLVWVYQRFIRRQPPAPFAALRIVPLLAVVILLAGIVLIGSQEVHYMGKRTFPNIMFYLATWSFAVLSAVMLAVTILEWKKSMGRFLRVYAAAVAGTFVTLSLFLWTWGVIGLKLWM